MDKNVLVIMSRWKVRGSPESLVNILWQHYMSIPNLMAIWPGTDWLIDWLTNCCYWGKRQVASMSSGLKILVWMMSTNSKCGHIMQTYWFFNFLYKCAKQWRGRECVLHFSDNNVHFYHNLFLQMFLLGFAVPVAYGIPVWRLCGT